MLNKLSHPDALICTLMAMIIQYKRQISLFVFHIHHLSRTSVQGFCPQHYQPCLSIRLLPTTYKHSLNSFTLKKKKKPSRDLIFLSNYHIHCFPFFMTSPKTCLYSLSSVYLLYFLFQFTTIRLSPTTLLVKL